MFKALKQLAVFSSNRANQTKPQDIELTGKSQFNNHDVASVAPTEQGTEIKEAVKKQQETWTDLSQETSNKIGEALQLAENENWDGVRQKNNELTAWLQEVGGKLQLQQVTAPDGYECNKVKEFLLTQSQSLEKDFEEIDKTQHQEVKEGLLKKISINLEVAQQVNDQGSRGNLPAFCFGAAKQAAQKAVEAVREAVQTKNKYLQRAWNIRASCQWEKAEALKTGWGWSDKVTPLNSWDQAAEFAIKTFQNADQEPDKETKNALQSSGLYNLKRIEEEKENPTQFRESKHKEHLLNARDAANQAVTQFGNALNEKSEGNKRALRESGYYYLKLASLWDQDPKKAESFTRAHYEQELYLKKKNEVRAITGDPTYGRVKL
ncbi:MAG: hypothetical protein K2W99_03390 [Chthoniobacterales bacterium]|nr:hypothetical protein [Chthoniobacterales bacterium]